MDLVTAATSRLDARDNPSGWQNFNCTMCQKRGEPTPDTKRRGGILVTAEGLVVTCFRCGFRGGYKKGKSLSVNIRDWLSSLGFTQEQINQWSFNSWSGVYNQNQNSVSTVSIQKHPLPEDAQDMLSLLSQNCDDSDFLAAVEYVISRGPQMFELWDWMWAPSWRKAVLFPYRDGNLIVGWGARRLKPGKLPKYHHSRPPGFIFGSEYLHGSRTHVVVTEGVFDALSISGLAVLGNRLNQNHISRLKQSGKKIIMLPDRGSAGRYFCYTALEQGWSVSFPGWTNDIKDANDALKKYGRLSTVAQVIDAATDNPLKIKTRMKFWC